MVDQSRGRGEFNRSGRVDMALNPYANPRLANTDSNSFHRRYRVRPSRATLREFRDMSGKPLVGTLVWLAMRIGLLRIEKQVIDGPHPFAQDLCDLDAIQEPVRSYLLTKCETAEKLGFHTRAYSVRNSTGIEVHGGAVRMLHHSDRAFSSDCRIFLGGNSSRPRDISISDFISSNACIRYHKCKAALQSARTDDDPSIRGMVIGRIVWLSLQVNCRVRDFNVLSNNY